VRLMIPVLSLFASIIFFGCGFANSGYLTRDFEFGEPKTVSVGSIMLTVENGYKNDVYGWVVDAVRQELTYNGKSNNTIFIDYREYSVGREGAYIKDSFKQSLQYDISESRNIKFRTVDLEIVEANSNEITFIVVSAPTIIELEEKYKK